MTLDAAKPATPEPPAPCPQCGADTEVYLVFCDGHVIPIHRCRAHGDVVPAPQEGT